MLFGPTGVGKTDILFNLAKELQKSLVISMEVISADSMQVYRGMNIGTAKPTPSERSELPHWLVDVIDPNEQFDLGDFVSQAEQIVESLRQKRVIPVISGGTAYYFKHFLYGLPSTPSVTKDIRIMVEDMQKAFGNETLKEMLFKIDESAARRIHVNDTYRLSRALEVYYATGKPLSDFALKSTLREDYPVLLTGLKRPRNELYQRINARVDAMFENGLVNEVEGLFDCGYRETDPGMRGIGYREFFELGWFDSSQKDDALLQDIKTKIKTDSRRYAKRQMTFFSSMDNVKWRNAEDEKEIVNELISFIGQSLA